jgi:tRNA modification GTPase
MEATLDFAEEELPAGTARELLVRLDSEIGRLQAVIATWEEGRVLREGALVVICGRPNVGKSTLLNRLVGTDRAIVTDVPGTTRDTIEEQVVLEGFPFRLEDTAGRREAECRVERAGVERAQAVMDRADVLVYVVDASVPLSDEDRDGIEQLDRGAGLVVLNKSDLGLRTDPRAPAGRRSAVCSLVTGEGLSDVKHAIVECLGVATDAPTHAVISERHRQIIQDALNELNEAAGLLRAGGDEVVVLCSSHLRGALEHLGLLTGKVYDTELLDSIFSRFCVGK